MKLVLCDDHPLLVEALAAELRQRGHRVDAVVSTADQAVAAVTAFHPDVCVLGLGPDDAIDCLRRIRDARPGAKVLMLVAGIGPRGVSSAIDADVAGIVRKDRGAEEVVRAVAAAASGRVVVNTGPGEDARLREAAPAEDDAVAALRNLTPREREVLRRVVRGETTKQIARALEVTPSTTRTHVQNVLGKLGVVSRVEAAALVARTDAVAHPATTP